MTDDHVDTAIDPNGTTIESTPFSDARQQRQEAFGTRGNLAAVMRIPVPLKVVIGSTTMPVAALAKLAPGDLVTLDQNVGDKVDVVANGRVVARGEIVLIDGENDRFGVKIDEMVVGNAAL